MESKKGSIDMASPVIVCPNGDVVLKAPHGDVILRKVELHHDIKTKTTSIAIKAMALDLAGDVMKRRFKTAATKIRQAFLPVWDSMGAFLKSKSGQEAQFTGLQTAFEAYQLFDTLASGNFVDNMLVQLATVSIGIQKTTVEQHFTQLLLPFIQANNFIIEAKNTLLEGLSGCVNNASFQIKENAEIRAAEQNSSFKQSSKGASVGINLMNMTPSASVNWSKAEGYAKEYMNSHLMDEKQMINLKRFGDPDIFAIEYVLLDNPYYNDEFGLLRDSWGEFKIFISGEELLRLSRDGVEQNYTWNLIYVVEWFCENLKHILTIDNFFSPTDNESIIDKVCFFYDNYDLSNREINKKAFTWNEKHDLESASNGSFLPTIYMYSISDDKVEICWVDPGFVDDDIYFLSKGGTEKIDKTYFEGVTIEFVTDFLNNFQDSYPDEINEKFQMLNGL